MKHQWWEGLRHLEAQTLDILAHWTTITIEICITHQKLGPTEYQDWLGYSQGIARSQTSATPPTWRHLPKTYNCLLNWRQKHTKAGLSLKFTESNWCHFEPHIGRRTKGGHNTSWRSPRNCTCCITNYHKDNRCTSNFANAWSNSKTHLIKN